MLRTFIHKNNSFDFDSSATLKENDFLCFVLVQIISMNLCSEELIFSHEFDVFYVTSCAFIFMMNSLKKV